MQNFIFGSPVVAAAIVRSDRSSAATLNHVISFTTTGAPATATVDIAMNMNLIEAGVGKTAGLTVNSLNFVLDGKVLYLNPSDVPMSIVTCGSINSTSTGFATNDFAFRPLDFASTFASATNVLPVQGAKVFDQQWICKRCIEGHHVHTGAGTVCPSSLPQILLGTGAVGFLCRKRTKIWVELAEVTVTHRQPRLQWAGEQAACIVFEGQIALGVSCQVAQCSGAVGLPPPRCLLPASGGEIVRRDTRHRRDLLMAGEASLGQKTGLVQPNVSKQSGT